MNERRFRSQIGYASKFRRKFPIKKREEKTSKKLRKKERTRERKRTKMDNANVLSGGNVLLKSVSIFLSNRRQSKLLKEQTEEKKKKKRTKTLSKLDEQMGKLQPKMLESLKRKTHFNKWVFVRTCEKSFLLCCCCVVWCFTRRDIYSLGEREKFVFCVQMRLQRDRVRLNYDQHWFIVVLKSLTQGKQAAEEWKSWKIVFAWNW